MTAMIVSTELNVDQAIETRHAQLNVSLQSINQKLIGRYRGEVYSFSWASDLLVVASDARSPLIADIPEEYSDRKFVVNKASEAVGRSNLLTNFATAAETVTDLVLGAVVPETIEIANGLGDDPKRISLLVTGEDNCGVLTVKPGKENQLSVSVYSLDKPTESKTKLQLNYDLTNRDAPKAIQATIDFLTDGFSGIRVELDPETGKAVGIILTHGGKDAAARALKQVNSNTEINDYEEMKRIFNEFLGEATANRLMNGGKGAVDLAQKLMTPDGMEMFNHFLVPKITSIQE